MPPFGTLTRAWTAAAAAVALMMVLVACRSAEASPSADLSPSTADPAASASLPEGVVAVSLNAMDLVLSSEMAKFTSAGSFDGR